MRRNPQEPDITAIETKLRERFPGFVGLHFGPYDHQDGNGPVPNCLQLFFRDNVLTPDILVMVRNIAWWADIHLGWKDRLPNGVVPCCVCDSTTDVGEVDFQQWCTLPVCKNCKETLSYADLYRRLDTLDLDVVRGFRDVEFNPT